jgi:hypothetical protein
MIDLCRCFLPDRLAIKQRRNGSEKQSGGRHDQEVDDPLMRVRGGIKLSLAQRCVQRPFQHVHAIMRLSAGFVRAGCGNVAKIANREVDGAEEIELVLGGCRGPNREGNDVTHYTTLLTPALTLDLNLTVRACLAARCGESRDRHFVRKV